MNPEVRIFSCDQLEELFSHYPALKYIPIAHLHSVHVLLESENIIGYSCLYLNPDMQYSEDNPVACFGALHSPNEMNAAFLLQSLEKTARMEGVRYLLGPMNGSTWESYRWMRPSAEPLFFSEEKNQEYLEALALKNGYEIIGEYQSSRQDLSIPRNVNYRPLPEGVGIRNLNLDQFEEDLDRISELVLNGFGSNFLYTPISKDAFKEKYRTLKAYMKPEYILLAELPDKRLAALLFAFPDYLNPMNDTLVLKTIVRLPGRAYAGLIHCMQEVLYQQSINDGIRYWIHAFMWKQNSSRALSEKFNGERIREYVLVGKQLDFKS